MLSTVNPTQNAAAIRLLEFLSDRRPWHRSLWGIGAILAMEELHEACVAMRHGHLSEGAIKRIASSLQKRIGVHPAFTDNERLFLRQQLNQVPRADGAAHYGIRELSARVSPNYLSRWGDAVAKGRFTVETFARSVAAHILDAGFAGPYMHSIIKSYLDAPEPITLEELCNSLQTEMAANPVREFEVMLAFTAAPTTGNGVPEVWLKGPEVTAWLREHGFETSGVRAQFGMRLHVQARDRVGAAQAARTEADRYAARALLASGNPLSYAPWLWVKGSPEPAPMNEDSRGVGVKELLHGDRVFTPSSSPSVDAALELLSHLENSSPPAAVAGGWGAIEGLLSDPSDRSSAADNLATLVACSFPRAELTTLSYKAQREFPDQFHALKEALTNRERSRIVARKIIDNTMPQLRGITDQAAVARVRKLLANPQPELQTIRDSIGESLHRLYRQRNLILHGARLDSVALAASLRTVAKLVGAGMDRITHGHYAQNLKPMELVAKANLALATVSREHPMGCVDLLEMN
ncbi:integrase [Pandoraea faecigallinarum]|uniref:Integrase n=1 Tax=Pandoraea faecigallinarum TaxID=656179 RepID=A0A0H3WMS3_9BURK|nr:hypothetical protein [Pandoraea faecigallinarum]AKM29017.1 integrase [Pandoraea faecigallinarum]